MVTASRLECDGPSHFDEHGIRTVEDLERLDILERAGWRILHITYRNWRESPDDQLARIDSWFEGSNREDDADESDSMAADLEETDGPRVPVSQYGKAIIDSIQAGNQDEEDVFRGCLNSIGYKRMGSRISADLKEAARLLVADGFITIEEDEYFLTPEGRTAQPYVYEATTPGSRVDRSHRSRRASSHTSQHLVRYPITCSRCGRPDTVPFKPTRSRDLLCRACYYQRKRSKYA